jgi:hypothetical protein
VRRNKQPVGVAAEAFGVAPHPGERAAYLPIYRGQIAARLIDIDEVDDDGMSAGAHERLGREGVFRSTAAAPSAAMDKDIHRRTHWRSAILRPSARSSRTGRRGGSIDVEALLLARPVGYALRRAEGFSRPLARGGDPPEHLIAVRRIDPLIVGAIERLLIHVAPDQRAARLCLLLHEGSRKCLAICFCREATGVTPGSIPGKNRCPCRRRR